MSASVECVHALPAVVSPNFTIGFRFSGTGKTSASLKSWMALVHRNSIFASSDPDAMYALAQGIDNDPVRHIQVEDS